MPFKRISRDLDPGQREDNQTLVGLTENRGFISRTAKFIIKSETQLIRRMKGRIQISSL